MFSEWSGMMQKTIGFMITGLMIVGCSGKAPKNLGVQNGMIHPCSSKPNCVISQTESESHKVVPIRYTGEKSAAAERLKEIVVSLKRTTLIEEKEGYLRLEFKSALVGFVDDVEFYFPNEPIIHVRSASRVGYSDIGVNRKRIKQIRALFEGR